MVVLPWVSILHAVLLLLLFLFGFFVDMGTYHPLKMGWLRWLGEMTIHESRPADGNNNNNNKHFNCFHQILNIGTTLYFYFKTNLHLSATQALRVSQQKKRCRS